MPLIKFGTDGWRDMMYDQFNLPNVKLVVQAIAEHVLNHQGQGRGIVIGYDARFFSDFFAAETAKILMRNGIKVYMTERDYPTPVIAFAVQHYKAFGAIMFTASHNPPEYNGIKFIPEYAGPASLEITKEIEANLNKLIAGSSSEMKTQAPGSLNENSLLIKTDPTKAYLEHLRTLVNINAIREAKLNIIVDPMFGTGRGFLTDLLNECSVSEIHNYRDPLFGGYMPDPQDKFLGELKTQVTQTKNSIGLATDGDADRFGIIDSDGTYLTPNQVISLLLVHLIKTRGYKGAVARTVATTHLIDNIARLHGVETIETPVGFKYIGEAMRTNPVIIGGEESGGLSIRGHIPEKDGVLACALMAEMMAVTKRPLMDSLRDLYRQTNEVFNKRIDIHLQEESKGRVLNFCKHDPPSQIGNWKVVDHNTKDGFKFILENGGWFLIRPSGTEPLIRVYFEASSSAELQSLTTTIQEKVHQWTEAL